MDLAGKNSSICKSLISGGMSGPAQIRLVLYPSVGAAQQMMGLAPNPLVLSSCSPQGTHMKESLLKASWEASETSSLHALNAFFLSSKMVNTAGKCRFLISV